MQTQILQATNTLNKYRTIIFGLLVLAVLIAFFIMPSAIAEAGRAVGGGS